MATASVIVTQCGNVLRSFLNNCSIMCVTTVSALPTHAIDRTTINKVRYDLHAQAKRVHHSIIKLLPDLLQDAPVHCSLKQMPDLF